MRQEIIIIEMKSVIEDWVKGYNFKDGEGLFDYEYFFDPVKNKLVLKLVVDDFKSRENVTKPECEYD